jgi:glycosyltransferase involved in cell wall biosynthesis
MILISIVSPVYKANEILTELVNRIENSISNLTNDYEIILVDDGCPFGSWDQITKLCQVNKMIVGIKLSRNFGQHSAISAGIDKAKGEYIIVMDCDLQDRPEEIPNLYFKALEGYDIVLARRVNRNDNYFKKLSSKFFYRTLEYLSGIEQDETVANFGIYNKKVINALKSMKEPIRFFPSMVKWVGFSKINIEVKHDIRPNGKTSYNYKKLLNLAIDIILSYSIKPIEIFIKLGFFISLLSFIGALVYFLKWLSGSITVIGYTSIIISLSFFSGLIVATLGVIGLYVAKTFESAKNRPIYIIEKQINN